MIEAGGALHELYVWLDRPFADVSGWAVAGVAAIYFVAFLARGAIGFGAIAPAIVLSSWLIPPHHAVLLAMLTATLPQLQLLGESLRGSDWTVIRPVTLALTLTIAVGVWIFANLRSEELTLVLGLVMSAIVVLDMTKALDRLAARVDLRAPRVVFGLSSAIGLVTGLAGAGGMMMLGVYLKQACRDHVSLRATAALLGIIMTLWRLVATIFVGLIDLKLLAESVILMPVVYVGIWLGIRYFQGMTPRRYYQIFQAVLLLSAVGLLVEGAVRVL